MEFGGCGGAGTVDSWDRFGVVERFRFTNLTTHTAGSAAAASPASLTSGSCRGVVVIEGLCFRWGCVGIWECVGPRGRCPVYYLDRRVLILE